MELEKFIKDYNLITTLSATGEDMCSSKYENLEVNIDNSISLYSIIENFNHEYNKFNKDLKKLQKLDIGKKINFEYYCSSNNSSYKELVIYIDEPYNIDSQGEFVYLIENKNCIFYEIKKDNPIEIDKDKTGKIKIEKSIIIDYLGLCEKYKLFLMAYRYLKQSFIFGDGCTTLFSKIDGDIFGRLKEFEFSFGKGYMNTSYFVSCSAKLGKLQVLQKGQTIIDSKDYGEVDKEKLLKKIYIDKSYLLTKIQKN